MNKAYKVLATTMLILYLIFGNSSSVSYSLPRIDRPFLVAEEKPPKNLAIIEKPRSDFSSTKEFVLESVESICFFYPNVDPRMVESIIFHESRFVPYVTNGPHIGLMQINQSWHEDRMKRLGVSDLFDPYSNLLVGIDYLSELIERYESEELALMMYSTNNTVALRMFEQGKINNYVELVLKRARSNDNG